MSLLPNKSKKEEPRPSILHLRGRDPAMLDRDVARVYGVETKVLNQAAQRNKERFPEPMMRFQATKDERSQIVTSIEHQGGEVHPNQFLKSPWLYTQPGAYAAAFVLNTDEAIQQSQEIIRIYACYQNDALATVREEVRQEIKDEELCDLLLLGAPADWSQRFPREFWSELARLRRWTWYDPDKHNTPKDAKHWVSWTIYKRIPMPVYAKVKELNPADGDGRRQKLHHQYFGTEEGKEVLDNLIREAIRFMRTSVDWGDFAWRWERLRPQAGQQMKMFAPQRAVAELHM